MLSFHAGYSFLGEQKAQAVSIQCFAPLKVVRGSDLHAVVLVSKNMQRSHDNGLVFRLISVPRMFAEIGRQVLEDYRS